MFVTAVCFLFLLKLKWPKNKNVYDGTLTFCIYEIFSLACEVFTYNVNMWVSKIKLLKAVFFLILELNQSKLLRYLSIWAYGYLHGNFLHSYSHDQLQLLRQRQSKAQDAMKATYP